MAEVLVVKLALGIFCLFSICLLGLLVLGVGWAGQQWHKQAVRVTETRLLQLRDGEPSHLLDTQPDPEL